MQGCLCEHTTSKTTALASVTRDPAALLNLTQSFQSLQRRGWRRTWHQPTTAEAGQEGEKKRGTTDGEEKNVGRKKREEKRRETAWKGKGGGERKGGQEQTNRIF